MEKENKKKNSLKSKNQKGSLEHINNSSPKELLSKFFDEDFWTEQFGLWSMPRLLSRMDEKWFPRVDVREVNNEIKVLADVPGVNPENIEIDVHGDRVTISGKTEKKIETDPNAKVYRYERSYGEFRREFVLPTYVKEDQIKAIYKDGVLTLTLPKAENENRKKIKIEKQ